MINLSQSNEPVGKSESLQADKMFVELWSVLDDKTVKASGDIVLQFSLGELTIRKVKVIHQDGKHPWVKLPEIRYLDQKSEEWKSISVLVPSRQLRKHITDEVLKVYESLCRARQDA
jgi:hypothetical protein